MRSSQQRCSDWSSRRPEGPSPHRQDSNATEGEANSLGTLRNTQQHRITHQQHTAGQQRTKGKEPLKRGKKRQQQRPETAAKREGRGEKESSAVLCQV